MKSKIKRVSNVSRIDLILKVLAHGVQIYIKNHKHIFCLREIRIIQNMEKKIKVMDFTKRARVCASARKERKMCLFSDYAGRTRQ